MVNTKKRNVNNKKSKKSKKLSGGGLAGVMQKGFMKATGQNEKCNLAVDPYSLLESKLYNRKKLNKKVEKLQFIKSEPELFKKLFTQNLNSYCVELSGKRYLKFCSNLLNCLKAPSKFYEVLYDTFNVDEKQPLTKQLYNNKKKLNSSLTMEKFIEGEKKLRLQAMAGFMIEVIFKSIIQYERKHPPEKKIPQHALVFKDKLTGFFKDINMDFDLKKISQGNLEKLLLDKEVSIMDYYTSRTSAGTESISTVDNKDKRTPTFLKIFLGVIASIVIIETGWFDAPPGVPGGIS